MLGCYALYMCESQFEVENSFSEFDFFFFLEGKLEGKLSMILQ